MLRFYHVHLTNLYHNSLFSLHRPSSYREYATYPTNNFRFSYTQPTGFPIVFPIYEQPNIIDSYEFSTMTEKLLDRIAHDDGLHARRATRRTGGSKPARRSGLRIAVCRPCAITPLLYHGCSESSGGPGYLANHAPPTRPACCAGSRTVRVAERAAVTGKFTDLNPPLTVPGTNPLFPKGASDCFHRDREPF